MVDAEAVQVKPAAAKSVGKAATRGSKKKAEQEEFEDYDANEYIDVDDSNGYAESGNEDEEAAAAMASPPKKCVRVNSSVRLPFPVVDDLPIAFSVAGQDRGRTDQEEEEGCPQRHRGTSPCTSSQDMT